MIAGFAHAKCMPYVEQDCECRTIAAHSFLLLLLIMTGVARAAFRRGHVWEDIHGDLERR